MRNETSRSLIDLYREAPYVFLTGDLGFMALEPLQEALGNRFINAGVAEQNMVTVAAGIASTGLQTWVYSIAPFVYARPFEQIRNDVCLHNFDVKLVGNGGGYAYGSMGSTHHALEDYGVMLALQNMRIYIPAFSEDVEVIIRRMSAYHGPAYLRLGRSEKPADYQLPSYAVWRNLLSGCKGVMLVIGPIVGGLIAPLASLAEELRPALWVVTELPVLPENIPEQLLLAIQENGELIIVEEHVSTGSFGHHFVAMILEMGVTVQHFKHHYARGYPSGLYGSQVFHRQECGLDAKSIIGAF